jgi:hypothetical protein
MIGRADTPQILVGRSGAGRIGAALDVAARSPEHFAPIHRRMLAVLYLDPVLAATAAIGPIAVLGD